MIARGERSRSSTTTLLMPSYLMVLYAIADTAGIQGQIVQHEEP